MKMNEKNYNKLMKLVDFLIEEADDNEIEYIFEVIVKAAQDVLNGDNKNGKNKD